MSGALLVIAPHPDDELLGAGGIMARAAAAGRRFGVVVATDGSRSDPTLDSTVLAARRQNEARAGLKQMLGAELPLLFLGHIDGGLVSTVTDVSPDSALGNFVSRLQPSSLLVTDPADAHPDHKAAFGLATRLISAGIGDVLQVMPVSQRIDGTFDATAYEACPVGAFADAKRTAIECHSSQIGGSTGFALSPETCGQFASVEYVRTVYDRRDAGRDAVAADHFDAMFANSPDPWGYDDTPYERDRFCRTIEALGGRKYDAALELGCANGALTSRLAPLCDRLVATDGSAASLATAQHRLKAVRNVTFEQGLLPGDVPHGPFDLIVASDMLYYLGLEGVIALMSRLEAEAAPDCRMLIASYLGDTQTRLTGEMASEAALAHLAGWMLVHAERTDRLRIDVLDRR